MLNENYYRVKEIYPWLYSIFDPLNVFCYLITGSERALLFDTGYGIGNLKQTISEITDKPLFVILGHGHIDHANGAYQFDEVFLHEKDFELCNFHTSEDFRRNILNNFKENNLTLPDSFDSGIYIKAGIGKLKKLEPFKIFDLGDLHIEVVPMEGHTAGSVGLLVKEHKVLLDSDSANPHVWMFLNESLSICAYIAMLKRVINHDFHIFLTGHSDDPKPKSDFIKYINAAQNASIQKSLPYDNNIFPELKGFIYKEDDVEIVFNETKLK